MCVEGGVLQNYTGTIGVNWCHLEQTGLYGHTRYDLQKCLAQGLISSKHL